MINDPEISAMSNVYEAMKGLDSHQMKRLFNWLNSKFGLDDDNTNAFIPVAPVVHETTKVEPSVEVPIEAIVEEKAEAKIEAKVEPIIEPIVEKKTRKKRQVKSPLEKEPAEKEGETTEVTAEETTTGTEEKALTPRGRRAAEKDEEDEKSASTKGFGLKRYKTIENLFLSSNTKTVNSRILLAAAFLQEKLNFTEITSHDINSRLKKMGYGVSNITTALYGLFKKNPPWLEYVVKEGEPTTSKKKFTVTEEGIKIAKTYLKGTSE